MSEPPSEPTLGVIDTNLGSKVRVYVKFPLGLPMSKYITKSVTVLSWTSTTLNTAYVAITATISYSTLPSKSCAFEVKFSPFILTYHAWDATSNSLSIVVTEGT